VILSAWHFDEAYANDEDDDRGNNDDDGAFIDIEQRHYDLEEANLMMITVTAADRDESDDSDE
jgi:hypothetical protein